MANWTAPPSSPAPRPAGFLARLWNGALVTLIYLLVGPPVGALVFLGLMASFISRADPDSGLAVFAFTAMFGVPLSYGVGGAPALIVGLGFALWQSLIGRTGWLAAAAVGVIAGLLIAGVNGGMGAELDTPDDLPLRPIFMLTCAAATLACWALTRNFVTAGPRR